MMDVLNLHLWFFASPIEAMQTAAAMEWQGGCGG